MNDVHTSMAYHLTPSFYVLSFLSPFCLYWICFDSSFLTYLQRQLRSVCISSIAYRLNTPNLPDDPDVFAIFERCNLGSCCVFESKVQIVFNVDVSFRCICCWFWHNFVFMALLMASCWWRRVDGILLMAPHRWKCDETRSRCRGWEMDDGYQMKDICLSWRHVLEK